MHWPKVSRNLWLHLQHTSYDDTTAHAWCMMPDAWCLMPDAWCLMHDAWCMMLALTDDFVVCFWIIFLAVLREYAHWLQVPCCSTCLAAMFRVDDSEASCFVEIACIWLSKLAMPQTDCSYFNFANFTRVSKLFVDSECEYPTYHVSVHAKLHQITEVPMWHVSKQLGPCWSVEPSVREWPAPIPLSWCGALMNPQSLEMPLRFKCV